MGRARREAEWRDGLRALAEDIALEAGAIRHCDWHEEITINQQDDDAKKAAYAIGTKQWKTGEIGGTREELMAAISDAIDESEWDCPRCEKMINE